MKANIQSMEIWHKYIVSGDTKLIHDILINNDCTIKNTISYALSKLQPKVTRLDEWYSFVYYKLFTRISKLKSITFISQTDFYVYLRRAVFNIIEIELTNSKKRNETVSICSLNEETEETIEVALNMSPVEDEILNDEEIEELYNNISLLSKREQTILKLYYGLDGYQERNLNDVAAKVGYTRERVRQLTHLAEKKLRYIMLQKRGLIKENKSIEEILKMKR